MDVHIYIGYTKEFCCPMSRKKETLLREIIELFPISVLYFEEPLQKWTWVYVSRTEGAKSWNSRNHDFTLKTSPVKPLPIRSGFSEALVILCTVSAPLTPLLI